ncbi:MAG TPA: hypothetical protein VN691_01090, partial [Steroidobacteraceae bacterium]|nr:hypothetical protein [Steroidobacteraceae bacterium]
MRQIYLSAKGVANGCCDISSMAGYAGAAPTDRAMRTELDQPLTQRARLGTGAVASPGEEAQLLHQDISGGSDEHAKLVGEEARAAGAVDLKAVVKLLDPVLDLTAT